jgi:hypothetical protein
LVAETDAHVHAQGAGGADALEFAGFQHAQQLGLLAQRDISDFIEENGAAVGEFEASDAVGAGVSKRAFYVAEEFTFK